MDHPIVEVHHDTDFNPSSNLLLLADNRTGLCRLMTMICSPGWIHKPRLHHTLERTPLVDNGDNEGINDDDMRPKSVDRAPKRWTKRRTTAGWYMLHGLVGICTDDLLAHIVLCHCRLEQYYSSISTPARIRNTLKTQHPAYKNVRQRPLPRMVCLMMSRFLMTKWV